MWVQVLPLERMLSPFDQHSVQLLFLVAWTLITADALIMHTSVARLFAVTAEKSHSEYYLMYSPLAS